MYKKYNIYLYNVADDNIALDISDHATFNSFTKAINGGLGECEINLSYTLDNIPDTLVVGKQVKIYVSDNDTITNINGQRLIYSGYISEINYIINNGIPQIKLLCLGNHTKLALDILRIGTSTLLYTDTINILTTTPYGSKANIANIVKQIINLFNTNNSILFNYTSSTIVGDATEAWLLFQSNTYKDAINDVIEYAPYGTYTYINENGTVFMKQKDVIDKHVFNFNQHFNAFNLSISLDKMKNNILIHNGGDISTNTIYRKYTNQNSTSKYGIFTEKFIEKKLPSSTSAEAIAAADLLGQTKLTTLSTPTISLSFTINDNTYDPINGYDIESIQPGDTCRFMGINNDKLLAFNDNALITSVDYKKDRADVIIELTKSGIINHQTEILKSIKDMKNDNNYAVYTEA